MEFLSPAWFSALAAIILIDLVLAGDNAIVIALAAFSFLIDFDAIDSAIDCRSVEPNSLVTVSTPLASP